MLLPPDGVELLDGVVPGGPQPEELRALVADVALGRVQLRGQVVALHLPLANDLKTIQFICTPFTLLDVEINSLQRLIANKALHTFTSATAASIHCTKQLMKSQLDDI